MTTLQARFEVSAEAFPGNCAVADPATGDRLTYRELGDRADRVCEALRKAGARAGDRIGLCLPKSIHSVTALLGVLKAGAAYVPVDAASPPKRNAFIFSDCQVRGVLATEDAANRLQEEGAFEVRERLLDGALVLLVQPHSSDPVPSPDLAYVLYTSGSTGNPKGVMLTHANALSFVDWCAKEFQPTSQDRFSSHAPFHFDLSILDLYVPLSSGASIVLLNEALGKNPSLLAESIELHRITCWYSTPSILRLLVELGNLGTRDLSGLRLVNFAGEVFPAKHLRALKEVLPRPVYYNLYGPTETNVCTYYRIPDLIPADRSDPYPIGYCCGNDRARVVDAEGKDVTPGSEGELIIAGGTVMQGYWNLPERSEAAFIEKGSDRWYRTGDIVSERPEDPGCYEYVGRRDRMVKRRGYRVELGEIEAAFHRHEGMKETAAVALQDEEAGMLVRVFLVWDDSVGKRPSTIKLKQYSAKNLPAYMIPDRFVYLDELPQTSTDKIDYQRLAALE